MGCPSTLESFSSAKNYAGAMAVGPIAVKVSLTPTVAANK